MTRKLLPTLPAERALRVIAGRWKAVILYRLFDGPLRLSQLERELPQASQKVLIQQLREMAQHGLVNRSVFAEGPMRVEYRVTELGLSLQPLLLALCDWGRRHAAALNDIDRLRDCAPPQRWCSSRDSRASPSSSAASPIAP
jgi:DNA-binding HxlR family transcriptional regulator